MSIHQQLRARRRRAQWGGALLAAAVVFAGPPIGIVSYQLGAIVRRELEGGTLAYTAVVGMVVLLALTLAIGSWLVLSALLARPRARRATVVGAVAVIAGAVLAVVGIPVLSAIAGDWFGPVLLVTLALLGFGAAACASAWERGRVRPAFRVSAPSTRGTLRRLGAGDIAVVIAATLVPLSLSAAGLMEALVWGPEAQTDGLTAAEVWAALSDADVASARTGIIGWAGVAALLSALPALVAVLARRHPVVAARRAVVASALFAGGLLASLQWIGTFSLGMSIADTLPPYSGSVSPEGTVLAVVGALLLASFTVAALVSTGLDAAEAPE